MLAVVLVLCALVAVAVQQTTVTSSIVISGTSPYNCSFDGGPANFCPNPLNFAFASLGATIVVSGTGAASSTWNTLTNPTGPTGNLIFNNFDAQFILNLRLSSFLLNVSNLLLRPSPQSVVNVVGNIDILGSGFNPRVALFNASGNITIRDSLTVPNMNDVTFRAGYINLIRYVAKPVVVRFEATNGILVTDSQLNAATNVLRVITFVGPLSVVRSNITKIAVAISGPTVEFIGSNVVLETPNSTIAATLNLTFSSTRLVAKEVLTINSGANFQSDATSSIESDYFYFTGNGTSVFDGTYFNSTNSQTTDITIFAVPSGTLTLRNLAFVTRSTARFEVGGSLTLQGVALTASRRVDVRYFANANVQVLQSNIRAVGAVEFNLLTAFSAPY